MNYENVEFYTKQQIKKSPQYFFLYYLSKTRKLCNNSIKKEVSLIT